MSSVRVGVTMERLGLWILAAFTVVAIAGFASFGLNAELLARFPRAVGFYHVSFGFFAQGHVLICAAILFLYLFRRSRGAWLGVFAAVYAISLGFELAGTRLGIPFGSYEYSSLLGPKWFENVPLLIPLSWFAMAVPSFALSMVAFSSRRPVARIVFASFLLVLWDLALDPAMSYLAPYWRWAESGAYYGMPAINLFGWAITAIVIMTVMHAMEADRWLSVASARWMVVYYGLTLAMPFGMVLAAGLWWAVAATIASVAIAGTVIYRSGRSDTLFPGNLAAEPVVDPVEAVTADAVYQFFRAHSRSFSFAARWFPPEQRRQVACLYMLCRTVDDIVDRGAPRDTAGVDHDLDLWFSRVRTAYLGGSSGLGWLDEIMHTSRGAGVPFNLVEDLFEGVRSDNGPVRIRTWEDLDRYTYCVASVVGIWMCYLFGVRDRESLRRAANLGRAMQMTNILRDVGEDLRQDRIYLPQDLMAVYGISTEDLHRFENTRQVDDEYSELILAFMARTNQLYARAWPGIVPLPPSFGRATAVAAEVYRGIHGSIRRNRFNNLTRRASTTPAQKILFAIYAAVKLGAYRTGAALSGLRESVQLRRAVTFPFAAEASYASGDSTGRSTRLAIEDGREDSVVAMLDSGTRRSDFQQTAPAAQNQNKR